MNKQSGREFASVPAFSLKNHFMFKRHKGTKKPISNKNQIFIKKIGENYCSIEINAYLRIESKGDSTDAAGSANTKQDRQ